ncbi:MAG TPA: hypothetical protein VM491_08080, partial [Burkholderiaceae bacterium]|nr:hypothetical protein [Burkholderiaceae bacterium]
RGVILMGLDAGESLAQAIVCGEQGLQVTGIGRGGKPAERTMSAREIAEYAGTRARKGRLLEPRWKEPRLAVPKRA